LKTETYHLSAAFGPESRAPLPLPQRHRSGRPRHSLKRGRGRERLIVSSAAECPERSLDGAVSSSFRRNGCTAAFVRSLSARSLFCFELPATFLGRKTNASRHGRVYAQSGFPPSHFRVTFATPSSDLGHLKHRDAALHPAYSCPHGQVALQIAARIDRAIHAPSLLGGHVGQRPRPRTPRAGPTGARAGKSCGRRNPKFVVGLTRL